MATKDPTFAPPLNELLTANPVLAGNNVIQAASIQGYPSNPYQFLSGDGSWRKSRSLIQDQVLSAAAASITFQVPNAFRNLTLFLHGRGDTAATSTSVFLRFNGDVAANYRYEAQNITGAAATAPFDSGAVTSISIGDLPAATSTANYFSAHNVVIFGYTNMVANKMAFSYGSLWTTVPYVQLFSGFWNSTAAITSISLFLSAGNFVKDSQATLYGEV